MDRFNQTDYQIFVHLKEILIKTFKEQDWEDDLQVVTQNVSMSLMFLH